PATSRIGRSSAATASIRGLRLARDSIGCLRAWKLLTPSSLTLDDSFTTSLFALITAVLRLIASRFLLSTVTSEQAVLLRNTTGKTTRIAILVMACTLHPSHLVCSHTRV